MRDAQRAGHDALGSAMMSLCARHIFGFTKRKRRAISSDRPRRSMSIRLECTVGIKSSTGALLPWICLVEAERTADAGAARRKSVRRSGEQPATRDKLE